MRKRVKEINSGIYVFNGRALKNSITKIDQNNVQNELYLTDAIKVLVQDGELVSTYKLDDISLAKPAPLPTT